MQSDIREKQNEVWLGTLCIKGILLTFTLITGAGRRSCTTHCVLVLLAFTCSAVNLPEAVEDPPAPAPEDQTPPGP